MTIKTKKLATSDSSQFVQLIRLFEEVFGMEKFSIPPETHILKLLSQDGFYVFVAVDENEQVVGGLTAYTLTQYYSTKPLVYIFDLAVKTDLQRKGIGTQLILATTHYCRQAGVEEVFVQADRVDDYAVNFYRKTAAIEENVVHFYYPLDRK
jgi:aminoglycoside 3-N-acetyltransferase I